MSVTRSRDTKDLGGLGVEVAGWDAEQIVIGKIRGLLFAT